MLITIDEYYDIDFYNESIQALKNNGVEYKQYILAKPPYSWYIDLPDNPLMINYDNITSSMKQFLVNTVEPAYANEAYLLQRRPSVGAKKSIEVYILNNALKQANNSDYACFFNIRNKEQIESLSKDLGKIYFFGRYYNNKFKIGLCTNKMIQNFVPKEDILVTKTRSVLQMELDLNYKVFKLKTRLRKFSQTPYWENGNLHQVKISQFNLNL